MSREGIGLEVSGIGGATRGPGPEVPPEKGRSGTAPMDAILTAPSPGTRSLKPLLPLESALPPPEAHAGGGAAVGVEDLAGDEVRGVGDEEGDRGAYVLRATDAAPGD